MRGGRRKQRKGRPMREPAKAVGRRAGESGADEERREGKGGTENPLGLTELTERSCKERVKRQVCRLCR